MRISDWSSDVCSSDLAGIRGLLEHLSGIPPHSAVRPPQKSLRAESSSLAIRLIDNKSIHREIQLDHCIQAEVIPGDVICGSGYDRSQIRIACQLSCNVRECKCLPAHKKSG